jgi:glucose-6-phosphate isomerase
MAKIDPLPLLSQTSEFEALASHHQAISGTHLRDLFREDPDRAARFSAEGAGVFLDYSKNRITQDTMVLLLKLAEARGLRAAIDAMFSGEKINLTEGRAVLHTALRAASDAEVSVEGKNVVPHVHAVLQSMATFAKKVREGSHKGPKAAAATGASVPTRLPMPPHNELSLFI